MDMEMPRPEPARPGFGPQQTCPNLGLPADPASRYWVPHPFHRCYATGRPRAITLGHQQDYCTTASHPSCPYFRQGPDTRAFATGGREPGGSRRRGAAAVVAGVAAILTLGIAAFALSGREAGPRAAAREDAPPVVETATARSTITPPAATATATATGAAGFVHQVQPGESLTMIAERYGTSVEALVAFNGLTNPSYLEVGQRIRIPPPSGGTGR